MAVDFKRHHKQWFVLLSELLLFAFMLLDIVMYISVKKKLNAPLGKWVFIDLATVMLCLAIFLYIYIREENEQEITETLEITIVIIRYFVQIVRILVQFRG